jgi:phenylacetate-coenzyme A ligase PaaK-like adenylate-forming protein
MGRHGDVFRIGASFLSYQKFQKLLIDKFDFEGSFQIHLEAGSGERKEKVLLKIENFFKKSISSEELKKVLLSNYRDLYESVEQDHILEFEIILVEKKDLEHSANTGKLRSVLDHRN